MKTQPGIQVTLGGIDVTNNMQVIKKDGGHRYSVQVIYVGMTVTVLKTEERVLIYDRCV